MRPDPKINDISGCVTPWDICKILNHEITNISYLFDKPKKTKKKSKLKPVVLNKITMIINKTSRGWAVTSSGQLNPATHLLAYVEEA